MKQKISKKIIKKTNKHLYLKYLQINGSVYTKTKIKEFYFNINNKNNLN